MNDWEKECQALRHANRLLRDGHEAAKLANYEAGRRDMMQAILRMIRANYPAQQYIPIETLQMCWPKETG